MEKEKELDEAAAEAGAEPGPGAGEETQEEQAAPETREGAEEGEDVSDTPSDGGEGEGTEGDPEPDAEEGRPEPEGKGRTFTQEQVNELVGKARKEGRESAMRALYERYGVVGDSELDGIFGKGQAYDGLSDDYESQGGLYREALTENALLKARVSPERWADAKAILGAMGLDVTEESIESLIPSHPEWRPAPEEPKVLTPGMAEGLPEPGQGAAAQERPATLRKLGGEPSPEARPEDEESRVRRLYGID